MSQQALCLSFLLLSLILPISTEESNIYVRCSKNSFAPMTSCETSCESNVDSLFASLADLATVYNFNKFETSNPQGDNVYGLFQCRGDLSCPNCKECVASAISQLKATCPLSTAGEIQLEGCFVKYDNTSFFGVEDKMEACRRCGPSIGYNADVLNRVDGALAYLVGMNDKYFRVAECGGIQVVAQCVQDLSLGDCQDCLSDVSGRLRLECETSERADMYLGKCYIRYVDRDMGNHSSDKRSAKGIKKWYKWIIGYTLTTLFGVSILIISISIWVKQKRIAKEKKKMEEEAKKKKAEEEAKKKKAEEEGKKKKKDEKTHGCPTSKCPVSSPKCPVSSPKCLVSSPWPPYPYCPQQTPMQFPPQHYFFHEMPPYNNQCYIM